jgi:hypothetical protein
LLFHPALALCSCSCSCTNSILSPPRPLFFTFLLPFSNCTLAPGSTARSHAMER